MDDRLRKNQEPDQPQHGEPSRASLSARKRHSSGSTTASGSEFAEDRDPQSMSGGSQHDQTGHAGSPDVTEGATGATGTDIGNRPE